MDAGTRGEANLLEGLLENLPDVGSERERCFYQAARRLRAFAGRGGDSLPPGLEDLALRLTRDALLDLYGGFRLGTFRGISGIPRSPGEPPAAQTRLRERLEALACVEVDRAEMFRWFLAGLRHELGQVLREWLRSAPPTWDPRRLLTRWRGRLAFALAQAIRTPVDEQNPEHEFGLYGLHLLFASTREIFLQEFQALGDLMTGWMETYSNFPELELRDLVQAMALASLAPEQVRELVNRLLSWHDLEHYPAERSFFSRRKEVQAKTRDAGYGQAMTALAVLVSSLFRLRSFPNSLGEEYQRYREEINRRERLASALAGLALQDEGCLLALAEVMDVLLEMQASVEANFVLMDALPAFLAHPTHLTLLLETLGRHGLNEFDEMLIDKLRNLQLQVSQEALDVLLDLLRRYPAVRWPLQILENVGGLAPQAEEWLGMQVQDGGDDRPVVAALTLHQRLSALRQSPIRLENALRRRLKRSLEEGFLVPDDQARWMLNLRDEALRRLLLDLAHRLESASLQVAHSLSTFLRALAVEVSHAERPNPVKLVACWLVDPNDALGSGLPLVERLARAAKLLGRRQLDAEIAALLAGVIPEENPVLTAQDLWNHYPVEQRVISAHPRLATVLLEPIGHRQEYPMRASADRRLALARALGRSSSPEHAIPLLADLFQLAVEIYMELRWESNALAIGTLKALAQLEPVLPQAVALLEEILLAQYKMPEGGFDGPTLSPDTITREVLPLLVGHRLAPEAVPALVELLEHDQPPQEKHKQRIWQITLQWLSNTSALSTEQQEVIWRVGYTSPLILIRALALLVLGRQRPLSQRVWETVLTLLHTPWRQLYQSYSAEIARLSDRNAWLIFNPGDVFLLSGVAVALTAEWYTKADLLVNEQREVLHRTWSRASSDYNRTLEARLAHSTHPLTGKDWSNAKGLALSLCSAVGKSPGDDPDWLVRPGDLARNLSLTTG